jgi:hypothetical protein
MRPSVTALSSLLAFAVACSAAQQSTRTESHPGVSVPVPIADGPGGGAPAGAGGTAARAAGSAAASPSSSANSAPVEKEALPAPPDPEALRTNDQVEYTLVYENGDVRVDAVRRVLFVKPIVTARKMGRYAVELWIGRELIERVRFDFPMLAVEEPQSERSRSLREPPPLTKGPLQIKVLVPFSDRARRAVLLDRATGKELELTWPPVPTPARAPVAPPAASAPSPAT